MKVEILLDVYTCSWWPTDDSFKEHVRQSLRNVLGPFTKAICAISASWDTALLVV